MQLTAILRETPGAGGVPDPDLVRTERLIESPGRRQYSRRNFMAPVTEKRSQRYSEHSAI